jgi:transcription antitermination factor NusG
VLAPTAPDISPSQLCHRADPRDPLASGWSWWLFAAHARHLWPIAWQLVRADVPHLIPMRRVSRVKASRNRYVVDEPVFGGYLFVAGEDAGIRDNAMSAAPGRLRLGIPITDPAGFVHDLSQLLDAIEAGAPLGRSEARSPEPGDTYRVVSGPWEGKEGTLERTAHGGHVLLLHVHCLGRVVPLEIDAAMCEPIDD